MALFEGTIRENIFVEEIGAEPVEVVSKPAQGSPCRHAGPESDAEVIEHMIRFGFSREKLERDGLQFEIVNNGENLSQGEQQLVALMKAVYTDRQIVILDEATSNIDYQSEKRIMDFFYDRIQHKTLVTVAHRINTVLRCDRIVVLEAGRVVEQGATQHLLADRDSRFYALHEKMTENLG